MKQYYDQNYGNILVKRMEYIKHFNPISFYNLNFGFYSTKHVGLPHLMEHLICKYAPETFQTNAYTSTGHMSFICKSLNNLKKLIKQVHQVDFTKIPDHIIKQEIKRVSSEFNYRTYNLGNTNFYQQYNQSQCINSKYLNNLIIGNVEYYENISSGGSGQMDYGNLRKMMQELKQIYFIKENSYCYIEISASFPLDQIFEQLNIKKVEKFDMVKYPLKTLDFEYNPKKCDQNTSLIVKRTYRQMSQIMIQLDETFYGGDQHKFIKTLSSLILFTSLYAQALILCEDPQVKQNISYTVQTSVIYLLVNFTYPTWFTCDKILNYQEIALNRLNYIINNIGELKSKYFDQIQADLHQSEKTIISTNKEEYQSVIMDCFKYLSNIKIEDIWAEINSQQQFKYVFDHVKHYMIKSAQIMVYSDNKPLKYQLKDCRTNLSGAMYEPHDVVNQSILKQYIYNNQHIYTMQTGKQKILLHVLNQIQIKYQNITENLNEQDQENELQLYHRNLEEIQIDMSSEMDQQQNKQHYQKQQMILDILRKKIKKQGKISKGQFKKIYQEIKIKKDDKYFNYRTIFQQNMIMQKQNKNYTFSLQNHQESSQYPSQIINITLVKHKMNILHFDKLKQVLNSYLHNNIFNSLYMDFSVSCAKKDLITIQIYCIYTPIIQYVHGIFNVLTKMDDIINNSDEIENKQHFRNILYDFDNIVASINESSLNIDNLGVSKGRFGMDQCYYIIDLSTDQNDLFMQDIDAYLNKSQFKNVFKEKGSQIDIQNIQLIQQQINNGRILDSNGGSKTKMSYRFTYPLKIRVSNYNINCQKLTVYYLVDQPLKQTVTMVSQHLQGMNIDPKQYQQMIYTQFISAIYENLSDVDRYLYDKFDKFIYSLSVNVINCIDNKTCIKIQYLLPENKSVNEMIQKHEDVMQTTEWDKVFGDKTFTQYFELYVQKNDKIIYLIQQSNDVIERLNEQIQGSEQIEDFLMKYGIEL